MNERLIGLLDQLAGRGQGSEILDQLLQSDDPLEQIAQRIAHTDAFEYPRINWPARGILWPRG